MYLLCTDDNILAR